MRLHVHELTGCAPDPLAHYLKAMGILRLVSEQRDPMARGWWERETFHLATTLDREQLLAFFLEDYEPTPLVGPWGARSGFYGGSSERSAREALQSIKETEAPRLQPFRSAIEEVRSLMKRFDITKKPGSKQKEIFLRRLMANLSANARRWLEISVVWGPSGPSYPAIVGTGGNEGSGSYASNFSQTVVQTLVDRAHDRFLSEALFGTSTRDIPDSMAGQFLPMGVGPPNGGSGFHGGTAMNPWTFLLCLEGSVIFVPAVARYGSVGNLPHGSAPFAVRSTAAGYGSASDQEEQRGEQWFPLWNRPAALSEIRSVIAEGRARLGTATVRRPVDFARAVTSLGIARGVSGFQRYGYVQRNGLNVIAVSLGRWSVAAQPGVRLLDDIAPWVERLRRAASSDLAPASLTRSAQTCEEAMLAVCRDGAASANWRDLLVSLGAAEKAMVRSPRFTAERRLQPIPPLHPDWLRAAAADLPEFRLAVGLAGQHGLNQRGSIDRRDPIRRHFLPLDGSNRRFAASDDALLQLQEVVCSSEQPVRDGMALVRRRMQEAGRAGFGRLPLAPVPGTEAPAADIAAWINGEVDDALVFGLARPLMAIDWPRRLKPRARRAHDRVDLGGAALFHIGYYPYQVSVGDDGHVSIPLDPTPFTRLIAGDLGRASDAMVSRLSAAGLRPHVQTMVGTRLMAHRIASSLAFPLRPLEARWLVERFTHPTLSLARADNSASMHSSKEILTHDD